MRKKKLLPFLLSAIILTNTSLPVLAADNYAQANTVYEQSTSDRASGQYTESAIRSKLNNLMALYNGTYWTQEWANGSNCYAFATYIFNDLFDMGESQVGCDAYSTNPTCYKLNSVNKNVNTIGIAEEGYSSAQLETLLNSAQSGDFIQLKRRKSGSPHSAIVVDVNKDTKTITLFDANSSGDRVVKTYQRTYGDIEYGNSGVSLYRHKNYTAEADSIYCTHVQNIGWQSFVKNGAMSGTEGLGLRLEGLQLKLDDMDYSGGISYRTHVENIGWMDYVSNGAMSGTSGMSLRLEAINIRLYGEIANHYDVYYRVHVENMGWMDWAKNDAAAGTSGYGLRLEGIEIRLVQKGNAAPGRTSTPFMGA